MLSLVTGMAVPSGLTPSVTRHLRDAKFPYVVPARPRAEGTVTKAAA
jgi:hypothetical protein